MVLVVLVVLFVLFMLVDPDISGGVFRRQYCPSDRSCGHPDVLWRRSHCAVRRV
ncbi:hypothetical protein [Streptomyces spongiae]|uniref:hypothetical protein n=1 Tax=Streptomyces spongiae TaxID=565072 RepID=UPI0018843EB7|nr:hypothetical protein [Streptomyces spongiae]